MLHLGRRIAFSVNVGYLLEFQCPFEGYGIVDAAAEVDGIPFVDEELGNLLDLVVQLEGLLHLLGNQLQTADDAVVFGERQGAFLAGQTEGHQGEDGHLGGKGFGRSHANFRTRVRVGAGLGDAGNRRTHHVADADDGRALALGELDGGDGVGGFARLRDGDDDVVLVNQRVAIAELGGILHLDGNAYQTLEQVLADDACVPRSAARHDDEASGIQHLLFVLNDAAECHNVLFHVQTAAHAVLDGAGLLEDLLQHEMLETALFQLLEVQFQLLEVRTPLDVIVDILDF